jgi:CBS-domain-containing membrane protein
MLDCGSVMRPVEHFLYQDDPAQMAVDFMLEKHMGLVPIVDAEQRFTGLLSGDRLMHALLPKDLTMVRGLDRMSYLRESREELSERLDRISTRKIHEIMDIRVKIVHPDTPLIEALQILSKTQFVVPVVELETGRLLGAISFFTIITMLQGGNDKPRDQGAD